MSEVFVHGYGVVSPAGWGAGPFAAALEKGEPIALAELERPGWSKRLRVRQVPVPSPAPTFIKHPRMRRSSPITRYALAAALEALGPDVSRLRDNALRLGVIFCVMTGCVNYSRRFYEEILRDPSTASPLLFPETVFNAPSSHLASFLGATGINYTLVGDPGTFLNGVAMAGDWLAQNEVDGCLVVGAEAMDWVTADSFRLFVRSIIMSEGAGALYFKLGPPPALSAVVAAVTTPQLFFGRRTWLRAAEKMREELDRMASPDLSGSPSHGLETLLCDGVQGDQRLDEAELTAWKKWPGRRLSPKKIFGEALVAAAAWQCIAAVDAISKGKCQQAAVSVVGCNQQAVGARFECQSRAGILPANPPGQSG